MEHTTIENLVAIMKCWISQVFQMMTLSFTIPFITIAEIFLFKMSFSSWRQTIAFAQPRAALRV